MRTIYARHPSGRFKIADIELNDLVARAVADVFDRNGSFYCLSGFDGITIEREAGECKLCIGEAVSNG